MSAGVLKSVLRHLRARPLDPDAPTDADLLRRYAADRDELAFEELVRRHSPLVWGVCRRALAHHADAEDAFQATFLILVRNPRAVRKQNSLGCWLHGVAHRTAQRLRTRNAKQPAIESRTQTEESPVDRLTVREFLAALDDELARLPDAVRRPLVLCCLQEQTQDEAAKQLGLSLSTLKRRLDAGRDTLRDRLARRGVDLSVALAAAGLAAVPAPVAAAAVRVAIDGIGCGAVAVGVIQLAEGVGKAMWQTKARAWAVTMILAGGAVTGTGYYTHTGFGQTGGAGGKNAIPSVPSVSRTDEDSEQKLLEQEVQATEIQAERARVEYEMIIDLKKAGRATAVDIEARWKDWCLAFLKYENAHLRLAAAKKSPASPTQESPPTSPEGLTADVAQIDVKQAEADLARANEEQDHTAALVKKGFATTTQLKTKQDLVVIARYKLEVARKRLANLQTPAPAPPSATAPTTRAEDRKFLELELQNVEKLVMEMRKSQKAYEEQYGAAKKIPTVSRFELLGLEATMSRQIAETLKAERELIQLRHRLAILDKRVDAEGSRAVDPQVKPGPPVSPDMQKLREEKLKAAKAMLGRLLQNRREGHPGGSATNEDIYLWSRRVLDAEQEVTPNARIKSLSDHLFRMTAQESYTKSRVKVGASLADSASAASFFRLEAEQWLKEAESKQQPGPEKSNPLPPSLRGTVTSRDSDIILISIGADAGVAKGHVLTVYRLQPTPKYLGTMTVLQVGPKEAFGRFSPPPGVKPGPDDYPKPGDEVKPQ